MTISKINFEDLINKDNNFIEDKKKINMVVLFLHGVVGVDGKRREKVETVVSWCSQWREIKRKK